MKIFVTGATGFVGSHTALALLDAGHELRLLVRNEVAAKAYFQKYGYQIDDLVTVNMADKQAVKNAMTGCDAVFHAAAMVSLDPKKADEIYKNNVESIDAVIGSACDLGIENIVYVSSVGALFNPDVKVIDEYSGLGTSTEAYSRSKRDCEEYVRKLQKEGKPIQISYPSGVFGPDDPKLSECNHALITFFTQILPITSSGIQCVDVRDLAKAHKYLLENPYSGEYQQARFIVAGNFYSWPEFHALLEGITGKKIFSLKIPGSVFRFIGSIMDVVKKIYPVDIPITSESMAIITQWRVASSSKIEKEAGLQFCSGEKTFSDTAKWLADAGHMKKKYAGKAA